MKIFSWTTLLIFWQTCTKDYEVIFFKNEGSFLHWNNDYLANLSSPELKAKVSFPDQILSIVCHHYCCSCEQCGLWVSCIVLSCLVFYIIKFYTVLVTITWMSLSNFLCCLSTVKAVTGVVLVCFTKALIYLYIILYLLWINQLYIYSSTYAPTYTYN